MDREELKELFLKAMQVFAFQEIENIYKEAKLEFFMRELNYDETEKE